MSRNRLFASRAVLLAAAILGVPGLALAQTPNYSWTLAGDSVWSLGAWNPSVPPYGGSPLVVPQINTSLATGYTASNDLGATFALNGLFLNATSSGSIGINNSAANSLRFVANGATTPVIALIGNAGATVSAPLRIGTNLAFSGVSAANLTISGHISGDGSVTVNRGTGSVVFSGMNRYTGGTTINSGTVQLNTGFALGTGPITINGGTFRTFSSANIFNPVVTNAPLTVASSTRNRLRGAISGTAGIRHTGTGTLHLSGNNSYGGSTTIEGSSVGSVTEVQFSSNANLGASATPVYFKDNSAGGAITALTFTPAGSISLVHPLSIEANSEARITPYETSATMVLSGGVSGAGDLDIGNYLNSGIVELAGTNTYTGETWVSTGTLRFDGDSRLGNSQFIVLNGGCLMPRADWTTGRSVSINNAGTIVSSAINTDGHTIAINSLDYTRSGTPALTLYKYGLGSLQISGLTAPSIVVDAGNVTLRGDGTSSFASTTQSVVSINRGGSLILDNSGTNQGDRLPNSGTITMSGGTFAMLGNTLGASSETIGALSLGVSSFNVIDLRPAGAPSVTLNAASLLNNGGAGMLFRGTGLGLTSTMKFTSAIQLSGAGGVAGTPFISAIAGAFGDDTSNGAGSGFVTHDLTGVRLLLPTEYDATIVSGATANQNVSLSAPVAGINALTTINNLRLLNGSSVSGSATLNLSSGAILVPTGATASIAVGTLATNGGMHIRNNGVLSISSRLNATSTNFSGSGVTTVSAPVSGAIIVHEGTLKSGANNLFLDSLTVNINELGTWDLDGRSETVGGISQQNFVSMGAGNYGTMNVNGGTLTLNPTSTSIFTGKITGAGKILKAGAGTMVFNGQQNDFSGTVEIQQGYLRLNSLGTAFQHTGTGSIAAESRIASPGNSVLSCSTVNFNVNGTANAELKLSDNISTFSRPVVVDGNTNGVVRFTTRNNTVVSSNITLNRGLQIASASGEFSGTISGPGSIAVTHPDPQAVFDRLPITSMTGTNSYTGTTTVAGGMLLFTANVSNGGDSQFGNSTSAIIIGDTSAAALGSEISGTVPGTTLYRPITSGTGSGSINLSGRSTSGSVTFAGQITINRSAFLFSTMDLTSDAVGSVNFTGKLTGINGVTVGGIDFVTGQPRSWSHVILANSTSDMANGVFLSTGTLGIGASSMGSTGPLGAGTFGIGSPGSTEVPTLYAFGGPQTVHNGIAIQNNARFAGGHALTFNGNVLLDTADRIMYVDGAGPVTFNGVIFGGLSFSKDGSGTLALGQKLSSSIPLGVFAGTMVSNASQTPTVLNIGSGAAFILSPGGNKRITTQSLGLTDGATLDLNDGDLIVDYTAASPFQGIRTRLIEGFNGGSWNGTGIRSSVAATASSPRTGLGYAETSVLYGVGGGTFEGTGVDGTTVLVRYTALGDANLNGTVDSIDFGFLNAGYGLTSGSNWTDGDFNYDGKVNTLDFNELAGNFNANVPAPVPGASLGSVVPEPASALLVMAVPAIAQRRRRYR